MANGDTGNCAKIRLQTYKCFPIGAIDNDCFIIGADFPNRWGSNLP
jgi:hypothetical protein